MTKRAERSYSPETQLSGSRLPSSLALIVVAASLAAWALLDSRFRDAEGFLTAAVAFPLAISAGIIVFAAGVRFHWIKSAAWLALAIISQAASHQLIRAGSGVGYQHLVPPSELFTPGQLIFVLIIAAQGILSAAVLWRRRDLAERLGISRWKIAVAFVLISFLSATFSRRPEAYAIELAVSSAIQLAALCNVLVFALSLPEHMELRTRKILELISDQSSNDESAAERHRGRTVTMMAFAVIGITLLLSVLVYDWHPHIPDEVSYLLQAAYFADGKLFLPAPPVPTAFDIDLMHIAGDKWYSPFPPGWPAVLATGSLVGIPWIVNPLLSGVAVLLCYALVRELRSGGTALLVTLLLCVSPWFIFMGMSLMSHTLSLVVALLGALAAVRVWRRQRTAWALGAGVATGYLSLIRPLDGLIIAIILGTIMLAMNRGSLRTGALLLFTISCGAVASLVLPYNKALTGDARVFPLTAYFDSHYTPGANDMGFGPDRGLG